MIGSRICALIAVVSFGGSAVASAYQESDEGISQESWSAYAARGEYAAALASDAVPDGMPAEFVTQYLADAESQLLNFTGRYTAAHRAIAPLMFSNERVGLGSDGNWIDLDLLTQLQPVNALEYIREAIRGRNIVIINESHQMGHHRAFVTALLPILRAEGFTHFGMEALSEISVPAWNTYRVPVREMGFYFGDPLMTSVLSTAEQEGFDWFPYEVRGDQRLNCEMVVCSRDDRIQHREATQAQNIYDRVFEQDPEARVVLYVGLRHLDEGSGSSENGIRSGWMAAELENLTGYDPLTIDQVTGAGIGPSNVSQAARVIHDRFQFSEPSILVFSNGEPLRPPSDRWIADLVLFLPFDRQDSQGVRSRWLEDLNGRRSTSLNISGFPQRPIVVQAFKDSEIQNALPTDQFAVLDGENFDQIELMLPPGEYIIRLQTTDETIMLPDTVIVGD